MLRKDISPYNHKGEINSKLLNLTQRKQFSWHLTELLRRIPKSEPLGVSPCSPYSMLVDTYSFISFSFPLVSPVFPILDFFIFGGLEPCKLGLEVLYLPIAHLGCLFLLLLQVPGVIFYWGPSS